MKDIYESLYNTKRVNKTMQMDNLSPKKVIK